MQVTSIIGGQSGQLMLCKETKIETQNCPALANGVLAAKHIFASPASVGGIIVLPAGAVPLAKALKGSECCQTSIS